MSNIKRVVEVTIVKKIEIELMPSVFGKMTQEEYLNEFSKSLWEVDGIDDVVRYAARVVSDNGDGYQYDGIGLIGHSDSTYPRIPDVKYRVLDEYMEDEIVGGAE